MPDLHPGSRSRGLSLIELLLFIVVIGIALGAMLQVFVTATRSSADPALLRQQLAIAESMLREVTLMPFTWCEPADPNVATAANAGGCNTAEALGPAGAESRTGPTYFDNVNDYAGFTMAGIVDVTGQPVPGLAGYGVSVAVVPQALDSVPGGGPALKVTVTVTAPGSPPVSLQGWRTRHAPNAAD